MRRFAIVLSVVALLLAGCEKPNRPTIGGSTWQEQYDLGVRYLSECNYEEAIIAFAAAIEIDPNQAEAYVGRGNAYVKSGETEENLTAAQADYEKAIELDKLLAEVYLGLADTYVALGDSESAVNILRQGVETIGGDTLFRSRIDELTAETEQSTALSSESASGPRVERRNAPNDSYTLYYYDETGNLTHEERYDPDGTLNNYWLYYHDETGNLMRGEWYAESGTLIQYDIYYCDEAGNWMRVEHYRPEGTLWSISYYDETGNDMRYERYGEAGNLIDIETYN